MVELVKQGKLKEIADIRDETGLDGLKITIDLKRGVDPDKLMQQPVQNDAAGGYLFLQFQRADCRCAAECWACGSCLGEWTAFRIECVRRRTYYDLSKKREKLHLLKGLAS